MRREPTAVVGDLDSLAGKFKNIVKVPCQETNDLEKAAAWCRAHGYERPIVLGATGFREDHTVGNVFRALNLGLEVVTNYGRFVPLEGRKTFSVERGAAVSIFAPDNTTRMTSRGLEWPLDNVEFKNIYCATLNRTTAKRIVLEASKRVYVYFAYPKGSAR